MLPKSVERLPNRILGHAQFAQQSPPERVRPVRPAAIPSTNQTRQRYLPSDIHPLTVEHPFQHRRGPAAFINQLGSHWVRWFHLDPLVSSQFFQRDERCPFPRLIATPRRRSLARKYFSAPSR